MFKKILTQIKASWIFFQLEYLIIFQSVLNEGQTNNPLMKGINLNGPLTMRERQIDALMSEFKQIIINIIRQFLDVLQKNKFLGIESLFRFTSREHKDSILQNYDGFSEQQPLA